MIESYHPSENPKFAHDFFNALNKPNPYNPYSYNEQTIQLMAIGIMNMRPSLGLRDLGSLQSVTEMVREQLLVYEKFEVPRDEAYTNLYEKYLPSREV